MSLDDTTSAKDSDKAARKEPTDPIDESDNVTDSSAGSTDIGPLAPAPPYASEQIEATSIESGNEAVVNTASASESADGSNPAEASGNQHDLGSDPNSSAEDSSENPWPDSSQTDSSYLEESILPSEAPVDSMHLDVGSVEVWGGLRYQIVEPLPYGWYEGRDQLEERVFMRPGTSLFNGLPPHPVMPTITYAGTEGHIVATVPGEPVKPTIAYPEAFAVLTSLAQLVRFFGAQGFAVIDIDPEGLVRTADGVRLQLTPRLTRIGKEIPRFYREGFSPPEAQSGQLATGREGVHILGALLFYLVTGQVVPAEGLNSFVLGTFRTPGLPQLLARAMQPDVHSRFTPQEFASSLKSLQGDDKSARYGIGAATTIGLNPERLVNEDSYGYTQEFIATAAGNQQLIRACVADGIGGEEAGEVASQAAVNAFCRENPSPVPMAPEVQAEFTEQLAWTANAAVLGALQGRGGGCTLTGVVIQEDHLTLAHVGDSRAYIYSASGLERITRDHSLVSALVANGIMSEEEAQASPDRSTILRSLGSVKVVQQNYIDRLNVVRDADHIKLEPGDVLVLCSDGVCGEVEDSRIAEIVRTSRTPDEVAAGLINEAIELGAPDNATAVVVVRH